MCNFNVDFLKNFLGAILGRGYGAPLQTPPPSALRRFAPPAPRSGPSVPPSSGRDMGWFSPYQSWNASGAPEPTPVIDYSYRLDFIAAGCLLPVYTMSGKNTYSLPWITSTNLHAFLLFLNTLSQLKIWSCIWKYVTPSGEHNYNFVSSVSFACLKSFGFLNFWCYVNFLHVCIKYRNEY